MQQNTKDVDYWNRPPPIRETVPTGSYASLAESAPFVAEPTVKPPLPNMQYQPPEAMEVDSLPKPLKSLTPPPPEKPPSPPRSPPSPIGPPSGLMVALARLADLESQLDFALAKHLQVVRERELIKEQTKHLKELPVGVEAFEEDLAKLVNEK